MRVAILESIIMPAGHEVEFDRILVDELKKEGHNPCFFVPENFKFKLNYNADVEYLNGGSVITYAGSGKLKKIWLSMLREKRRIEWFDSAYEKACQNLCNVIIIPTATYRYLRTLLKTNLKNSQIPVYFIFHGINPHEKANFVKFAKKCEKYSNIHLKVITLRNDFTNDNLKNVDLIEPPVFKPLNLKLDKYTESSKELVLGFFGQYRREKNVRFFLDAFKQAKFDVPARLIMQGATARIEDSDEFEKIIKEYKNIKNIEFWHKNLIGEEWEKALLSVDVIIAPYAAERYRYHWSAMLFNAIGFYKPILQSPEMNPEVLQKYNVGLAIDTTNEQAFVKQLESFVNNFKENQVKYFCDLQKANEEYSHSRLIKNILK